jgi:hypothetical protein
LIELEQELVKKIENYFNNYDHKLEEVTGWNTIEVQGDTLDKENKTIDLEMSFQHYVYKYSEN